jgi:hypothetical protein
MPQRIERKALNVLGELIMQVTRDVALRAQFSVQARVMGIRALAVYRSIIEHKGTAYGAAHRLVTLLDEVSAGIVLRPDADLATRQTEWAAAHLMSADPLRRMLAECMGQWICAVPPDFVQPG